MDSKVVDLSLGLGGEPAARTMLEGLDLDDEDIFFGPITDKEKLKSKKMRRKTEVYKPGFRTGWDKDEEDDEDEMEMEEKDEEMPKEGHTSDDVDEDIILGKEIETDCNNGGTDLSDSRNSQDTCLVEEEAAMLSPESQRDEEQTLEKVPKLDNVLLNTSSPQERPGDSEPIINVDTPTLSLVTVSPQGASATISENVVDSCHGVELFSARDIVAMDSSDSTFMERGEDKLSMNRENMTHQSLQLAGAFAVNIAPNSEDITMGQRVMKKENAELESCNEQTRPLIVKPAPYNPTSQSTLIYSSPIPISTSIQRVQTQDPLCYGNSPTHGPLPVNNFVTRMGSFQERTSSSSTLCTTEYSAFGKPANDGTQSKAFPHPQHLHPVPGPLLGSPASGPYSQVHNSASQPILIHKENVNPDRQPNPPIVASNSATKYTVLSLISSPVMSAQQAPSPRALQLSNRQSAASPSSAKRQLIEEKRALLARLRAKKQELRQRIKEDNEKCFNMKLENAAALQSNMARGMTPLFDRLPSQGCDGPAALTLTERELEMVTKLHTLRNSQQTSSDRTQSPCPQAMRHRDEGRLHWHEDLIVNAGELSSPSRPRCRARAILSKKSHNIARRGPVGVLIPSSSSSVQPRARQHLMF